MCDGTQCIWRILLKTEPSTPSPSWEGVASWIGHRDTRFRCLSVVLHCQVACSRLNPSTLPAQGRAFNTFPLMGDVWVPAEILEMKPLAKNFFENTATVQVGYREGGGGKGTVGAPHWGGCRRRGKLRKVGVEEPRAFLSSWLLLGCLTQTCVVLVPLTCCPSSCPWRDPWSNISLYNTNRFYSGPFAHEARASHRSCNSIFCFPVVPEGKALRAQPLAPSPP